MTEGEYAMRLGLPAAPAAAETMIVERDIRLVELTGARYHFGQISCRASLEAIAAAKARGLPITCGVAAHHLALNELDVGPYYTFMKVKPPLRSEADRAAMVEGVAAGKIDVIVSSHDPQAADTKRQPFAQAAFGAVGLETLLPVALGLYHDGRAGFCHVLKALTAAPAAILGLDAGTLAKGAPADLVLIDPDAPFVVDLDKLHSRARNTPFDGRKFQGRAHEDLRRRRMRLRPRRRGREMIIGGFHRLARRAQVRGARLSSGFDPVRADRHLARGPGRRAQDRLGQYRRHQRAADRKEMGRGADIAARCRQGRRRRPDRQPLFRNERRGVRRHRGDPRPYLSRCGSRFKGGKGVATFVGVMLAAYWPTGLLVIATWLAVAYFWRISSLVGAGRRRARAGLYRRFRQFSLCLAGAGPGRHHLHHPSREHPPSAGGRGTAHRRGTKKTRDMSHPLSDARTPGLAQAGARAECRAGDLRATGRAFRFGHGRARGGSAAGASRRRR